MTPLGVLTAQALTEFYKILGSADFLGNPVGLLSNLGTGAKDFFVEPAKGIVQGPEAFGRGVAKGTSSLVKKTVFATFNSVSKVLPRLTPQGH